MTSYCDIYAVELWWRRFECCCSCSCQPGTPGNLATPAGDVGSPHSVHFTAHNEPKWCTCSFAISFSLASYSRIVSNCSQFANVPASISAVFLHAVWISEFNDRKSLSVDHSHHHHHHLFHTAVSPSSKYPVSSRWRPQFRSNCTRRRWPWLVQQPIIMSNNHVFWMRPSDCSHFRSNCVVFYKESRTQLRIWPISCGRFWEHSHVQYTPPTPTRRNCRVASCRRCEHRRRDKTVASGVWTHPSAVVT